MAFELPFDIAADMARLQRAWPEAVPLAPPLYSHFCGLPARLAPAFPRVGAAALHDLVLWCHLFVTAVLEQDRLLDEATPPDAVGLAAMRMMALEAEASRILRRLFAPEARFWARYHGCLVDHARAYAVERAFRRGERPLAEYDEAVALRAAADKIGLARIAVAALAELDGDDALYAPITAALERVGHAIAMVDDLVDWRDDLRRGQPSLLLARAVYEVPPRLDEPAWRALSAHVSRAIYYGGHARGVLQLALAALDDADALERRLPGLPFYELTGALRADTEARLDLLDQGVRRGLAGAAAAPRPSAPSGDELRRLVRPWTLAVAA